MVPWLHAKNQKKLMSQFWEKLVTDGRTDWLTDGRTDGRTWFYRTLELFKFGSKNQKKVMMQFWEKSQKPHFWAFLALFGQIRIFVKNRAPSLFCTYGPLTSCKKSEKSNEAILRKIPTTSFLGHFWPFLAKYEFSWKIGLRHFSSSMVP